MTCNVNESLTPPESKRSSAGFHTIAISLQPLAFVRYPYDGSLLFGGGKVSTTARANLTASPSLFVQDMAGLLSLFLSRPSTMNRVRGFHVLRQRIQRRPITLLTRSLSMSPAPAEAMPSWRWSPKLAWTLPAIVRGKALINII